MYSYSITYANKDHTYTGTIVSDVFSSEAEVYNFCKRRIKQLNRRGYFVSAVKVYEPSGDVIYTWPKSDLDPSETSCDSKSVLAPHTPDDIPKKTETNYDHFKDRLYELSIDYNGHVNFGLSNDQVYPCQLLECSKCEFNGNCSNLHFYNWCVAPYTKPVKKTKKFDWSLVKIDTPIKCYNKSNEATLRYFAKYENGTVYYFRGGKTSLTNNNDRLVPIDPQYTAPLVDKEEYYKEV